MKSVKFFGPTLVLILALTAVLISGAGAWESGPVGRSGLQSGLDASTTVGSAFTYQGRLTDGGSPANGTYDFHFKLFDTLTGDDQLFTSVSKEDVVVTDGLFTVDLDFGSGAFDGNDFYLEIDVRPGDSNGDYTTLSPRQALTPVPYALYATGAWSLTGNAGTDPDTNFVGTTDTVPLVFKVSGIERMRIGTDGKIGIGDPEPTARLDSTSILNIGVRGESSSNYGVLGISDSSTGVRGHSISGSGLEGVTSSNIGVYGVALNLSGDTEGMVARAYSSAGEGLQAENVSSNANANIIAGCSESECQEVEFLVKRDGDVLADGSFTGPADFAEMMDVVAGGQEQVEPGDVLVIGPDGQLIPATSPYATNLAGVYSTKPGFVGDTEITEQGIERYEKVDETPAGEETQRRIPVALMGIVPVKVTAENGAIQPGDLLTTSNMPGHAMKAEPVMVNGVEIYPTGAILGKALDTLEQGNGVIRVLVTLR